MKNNYKKNYIWNTIGSFIISITSLIYTFILTRNLDLETVGVFSFGFSFACMMVSLASFGGRTFQVTDTKKEKSTSSYIIARYITVILTFLLVLIFLMLKNYNLEKNIVIILLCMFKFFEEISDVYYGIIQIHNKLYKVGQFQFVKSIINIILFTVGIIFIKNLIISILLITLNNLIFIFFIERNESKKLEVWKKTCNKQEILSILKINFYICGYIFLSTYLINVSKYSIDIYLSSDMQAIFNILMMPTTLMLIIGGFIINPILIDIANIYSENNIKKLKEIIKKILISLFIIGIIVLIFTYLIGTDLLNFIYGINFDKYKIELMIVMIGAILYTLATILGNIFIAFRKIKIQFYIGIGCAIMATIISNYLVSSYGINGGFYTYLITMFIRLVCYLPLLYNILKKRSE